MRIVPQGPLGGSTSGQAAAVDGLPSLTPSGNSTLGLGTDLGSASLIGLSGDMPQVVDPYPSL